MTLKARVIPCLDVKDGRVVKGVNFLNLVDAGDPVEAAKAYDAAGADELCFLDITASSDNRETIFDVVARTAEQCFMPLTVGGGVRTHCRYPQAAALAVPTRSRSIRLRSTIRILSPKRLTNSETSASSSSIDAKRRLTAKSAATISAPGKSITHGGRNATGIDAVEFAQKMVARGAGELLVTSMDRDGTKIGHDLELTRAIADSVRVPVIASGGVGDLDDLVAGVKEGHANAVLAASIFHFGTYSDRRSKTLYV